MRLTVKVIGGVLVVLMIAIAALPSLVENLLIPGLSARFGVPIDAEVRSLGWGGADLADIRLGPLDDPVVSIGSLRLDYSPWGLARARIDRVTASGVRVRAVWQEGGPALPGLELPRSEEAQPPQASAPAAPFVVRHLDIAGGEVELAVGARALVVPWSLEAAMADSPQGSVDFDVTLAPRDQRLTAAGSFEPASGQGELQVTAAALDLDAFADWLALLPGLEAHGVVRLDAAIGGGLAPAAIDRLSARLTLGGGAVRYRGATLTAVDDAVRLTIERRDGGNWRLSSSAVALEGPAPVRLGPFDLEAHVAENGYQLTGSFDLAVDRPGPAAEGAERQPFFGPLPCRLEAALDGGGTWHLAFSGEADGPARVRFEGGELAYANPAIRVSGSGSGQGFGLHGRAALAKLRLSAAAGPVLTVPAVAIEADVAAGSDQEMAGLKGRLTFDHGALAAGGLALSEIGLRLPFCWPVAAPADKGSLTVASVKAGRQELGPVSATIGQEGLGLVFEAKHDDALVDGLTLRAAGRATYDRSKGVKAAGTVSVPFFATGAPIELGRLSPAAAGYSLSGSLGGEGRWRYDRCGLAASASVELSGGILAAAARDLRVEGIDASLTLSDPLNLRSAPQQRLRFTSFQLGELHATDGELVFQLESPDSLFLEQGGFRWCDGQVSSGALRIMPGRDAYRFVLRCDRLRFSEVLEQFGAAGSALGEGRVNGRIPVSIEAGRISFDDAFLYSTPGQGGTLKLAGTESLTAGLPMDSPQFSQLDLAREALKDFSYDWARMTLTTEGEDLLLALELDGKPAKPLPFVYRQELGGFARVEADSPGSHFQGIRLDVNFRLPLESILYYGSSIRDMLK